MENIDVHKWIQSIGVIFGILAAVLSLNRLKIIKTAFIKLISNFHSINLYIVRRIRLHLLRLDILIFSPRKYFNSAIQLAHKENNDALAHAFKLTGRNEDAINAHLGGALLAVAIIDSPSSVPIFIEDQALQINSPTRPIIRAIETIDLVGSDLTIWQKNRLATVPLINIANILSSKTKYAKFPQSLSDISEYIKSKPTIKLGLQKIRDESLIQPIDEERLRALKTYCVFRAPSTILPDLAINLFSLSEAIRIEY